MGDADHVEIARQQQAALREIKGPAIQALMSFAQMFKAMPADPIEHARIRGRQEVVEMIMGSSGLLERVVNTINREVNSHGR